MLNKEELLSPLYQKMERLANEIKDAENYVRRIEEEFSFAGSEDEEERVARKYRNACAQRDCLYREREIWKRLCEKIA